MVIPLSTPATEGALLVPYPATLDVPHELVEHVAWLLYEHRRARDTRWRKLGCFDQALLTLVRLRKNETFAQLGAGFAISQATAWRYVDEALEVLASWAPALHEALTGLDEGDHVIVDGTLLPTDRVRTDQPYYSQKHKKHGMNVQVIARPDGTPLWFSRATPGRTHDLTSARAHGIVQACPTRQILVLADHAYQGAGATFRTPTTTANSPSTTSSSTATTLDSEPPANVPSPDSSPGASCAEHAPPHVMSAAPSKPTTYY